MKWVLRDANMVNVGGRAFATKTEELDLGEGKYLLRYNSYALPKTYIYSLDHGETYLDNETGKTEKFETHIAEIDYQDCDMETEERKILADIRDSFLRSTKNLNDILYGSDQ